MCTAISYKAGAHYFGRNLDVEQSYEEAVTITPRNYAFIFRKMPPLTRHYAMIGMAYVVDGYPLYYDATNERGLSMAGLLFAGNAHYGTPLEGWDNISPFELIPWVLGQCGDIQEAKALLERIRLVDLPFRDELPLTPLHWMIADGDGCMVLETDREAVRLYENPVGVLTNNPPFPYQMMHLKQYRGLSNEGAENRFDPGLELEEYSRGMGALGLPGDLSSQSRFVRAAFHKVNSVAGESEREAVSQFFHLLGSVEMPRGSLKMGENLYEITVYSSCCNTEAGIYYYTTYDDRSVRKVDLWNEDLEGMVVVSYGIWGKEALKPDLG